MLDPSYLQIGDIVRYDFQDGTYYEYVLVERLNYGSWKLFIKNNPYKEKQYTTVPEISLCLRAEKIGHTKAVHVLYGSGDEV